MLEVLRWSRRKKFTKVTINSTRLAEATGDREVMTGEAVLLSHCWHASLHSSNWSLLESVLQLWAAFFLANMFFPWVLVSVKAEQKGGRKKNWSDEKQMLPRKALCFCIGRTGACDLQTWGRMKLSSQDTHKWFWFLCRFLRFFTIHIFVRFLITTKEEWELYNRRN